MSHQSSGDGSHATTLGAADRTVIETRRPDPPKGELIMEWQCRRSLGIAGLGLVLLATPVHAETIYARDLAGWHVSCYRNDETRDFSGCSATNTWEAGSAAHQRQMRSKYMSVSVSLLSQGTLGLSLWAPGWNLTVGDNYQVKFEFPDGYITGGEFEGKEIDTGGRILQAVFHINEKFVEHMMRSHGFKMRINDSDIGGFRLNGSYNAMSHALEKYVEFAQTSDNFRGTFSRPESTF